jgi:spore cortex formation protein SpoVR/YcgB (stage V sporulation)
VSKLITASSEWTFELLERFDAAIARHAADLKLDVYPNQIEIITSEQMLDAYATTGLPLLYPHWSYGKGFISNERAYRRGAMGLAYEIVINSNPCIAYLMEENSLPMQALVIAHACYGHNAFFKGNYLFRQWTDAEGILDYLVFARDYVRRCEERHGVAAVEEVLDACHALMHFGVDRYKRPPGLSAEAERERQRERERDLERSYDELWRATVRARRAPDQPTHHPAEPQENLLYFIEKNAPRLETWQREIVRIVRKLAQYFYPQGQTKLMNEGFATFIHHTILNRMYDAGEVDDGFMLEVLESHTNVVLQPGFDDRRYSGINPYALGFAMFRDLKRIVETPDAEDRRWFPDIAGTGDWLRVLDFAMRNYRDESFVQQLLSPRLMREFRLFHVADRMNETEYRVAAIHDEAGYRRLRSAFAAQYRRENMLPDIQVTRYDRLGDRSLRLTHFAFQRRPLEAAAARETLRHLHRLWGFAVHLETVAADGQAVATYSV